MKRGKEQRFPMLHQRTTGKHHIRRYTGTRPWYAARGFVAIAAALPGLAVLAVPTVAGPQPAFAGHPVSIVTAVGDENGSEDDKRKEENTKQEKAKEDKAKEEKAKKEKAKKEEPKEEGKKKEDKGKEDKPKDGKPIPCDPNALIVGIQRANADGGGTLSLAKKCVYTLTVNDGQNGLPPIAAPVTIVGNDSTIIRAANAASFRIPAGSRRRQP